MGTSFEPLEFFYLTHFVLHVYFDVVEGDNRVSFSISVKILVYWVVEISGNGRGVTKTCVID